MKHVVVTGATGFLGKNICYDLAANGYSVTGLGRNRKIGCELQDRGIRFEACELNDSTELEKNFNHAECVVHSAGLASPFGRYEDFYESNVIGTTRVMEAARSVGVKRIINISSPNIYFEYKNKIDIKESDPLPAKQASYYGATKLRAEQLAHEYAARHGLEIISLRPKGVIGAGDQNYLPRLMRAQKNGRVLVVGDGQSLIDLTCVENSAQSVRRAIAAPSKYSGRSYNITNGEPLMTDVFLKELFEAIHGPSYQTRMLHVPFAVALGIAGVMENYYRIFKPREEPPVSRLGIGLMGVSNVLNIDSARADLGYVPTLTVRDGIANFAQWWKTQGN